MFCISVAHAQSQTDYKLDDSLEHTYAYNTRDYILFCLLFINAHGTSALECSAVRLSPAVAIVTLAYSYFNIARIVFVMKVLKVRMHIKVTRFRNCAAQFRNCVAILKSEDNFEIGTQFRNFQIAQRNFEIAQIYNSRGTYISVPCCSYISDTCRFSSRKL